MQVKLKVEKFTFNIHVGQGYNDFAWLALTGAKLYGEAKHPRGVYTPCLLKYNGLIPHPRDYIYEYLDEDKEKQKEGDDYFELFIKHASTKFTDEHEDWFEKAFGEKRNLMTYTFSCLYDIKLLEEKKSPLNAAMSAQQAQSQKKQTNNIYYVHIVHKMFPEIRPYYQNQEIEADQHLLLEESTTEGLTNYVTFSSSVTLPFGDVEPKEVYYMYQKDITSDQQKKVLPLTQFSSISSIKSPNVISQDQQKKRIKEHIKQMTEDLAKEIEAKQEETKMNQTFSELCPFTYENLWNQIEISQDTSQNLNISCIDMPDLKNRLQPYIADQINKLYEIFYQYTFLHTQEIEKKEQLKISVQDMLHCLKFYQISSDSQALFSFLEYYDVEKTLVKNFEQTLSIDPGINFHQFFVILLKAVHYQKESFQDPEDYDELFVKVFQKMLAIDSNEEMINDFHKYMKYNMVLIQSLREKADELEAIFKNKLKDSLQISDKKYYMYSEEIIQIILDTGFTGDNVDDIIKQCYTELLFDNYTTFEGIFYYEFLQALLYLSLILVYDQEQENSKLNEQQEEEAETLVEKFKFLLQQLKN